VGKGNNISVKKREKDSCGYYLSPEMPKQKGKGGMQNAGGGLQSHRGGGDVDHKALSWNLRKDRIRHGAPPGARLTSVETKEQS